MSYFFSGAHEGKLDEKNRVVLPHDLRYGLVENGVLRFSLALGMGGCLSIYRKSDIDRLVEQFQKLQYVAKYQKFLTVFFSTLFQTECDKVGRITLPPLLKQASGISQEVVIAGVLNKIEVWPKEVYSQTLSTFLEGADPSVDFGKMTEEALGQMDPKETDLPLIGKANDL